MRLFAWVVAIVLMMAVVFVGQWDESLDPQARQWLGTNKPAIAAVDNGYFTLLGLFAALSDNPHDVGRKRVQAYELALSSTRDSAEIEYDDYPATLRQRVDEEFEFLCQVEKSSCVSRFLEHADNIVALTEKHRILLGRYHSLYDFPEFRSTATPGIHEPLIPYHLLTSLNRLLGARMSVEFHTGSRLKAIEGLHRDMRFLRKLLETSDQLMLKILVVQMLARDLHTLSQLLDSKLYLHEHLPVVDDVLVDLSPKERTVDVCIRREFEAMANLMLTMKSARPFDADNELPDWMMKTLYKPNATVNRMFRKYQLSHELATLPPPALARKLSQLHADDSLSGPTTSDYVLNPVGTILTEVAAPDLNRYLPVLTDATGLLRLVRLKRMIRSRGLGSREVGAFLLEQDEELGSPYDASPMTWDSERQVIYFQGLSQHRHLQELALIFLDP